MPKEPRVKGVAFRSIDACYLDLRGIEALERARDLMPRELGDLYRQGLLLVSSWYPISWYRETFRAFRAATNDGSELVRQIGSEAVKRDMRGVYKAILVRLISPQTLFALSGRLFSNYYDTGKLEIVDKGRGHVRGRAIGCVGWDHNMWTEACGSCQGFLEIAGAKDVRVHVKSGGQDGGTEMELEAYWV